MRSKTEARRTTSVLGPGTYATSQDARLKVSSLTRRSHSAPLSDESSYESVEAQGDCGQCETVHQLPQQAHALFRCTSNKGCQVCGQRHHTLLHLPSAASAIAPQAPSAQTSSLQSRSSVANNGDQSQRDAGSEYRCYFSSESGRVSCELREKCKKVDK